LKGAWVGLEAQVLLYDQAQEVATAFRQFCLAHNLLDFSLQLDVFINNLWKLPEVRSQLTSTYKHLIYDNIEEDTPVAHDLLLEWLPSFDSALLIHDRDGGFRSFLGADPVSALRLKDACPTHIEFSNSFTVSPELNTWAAGVSATLTHTPDVQASPTPRSNA
jgi:hypothetical protein